MTGAEILALIDAKAAADPAVAAAVAARLDTDVAAAISVGRTRVVSKTIGGGTIIATLGDGSLLKAMRTYAPA